MIKLIIISLLLLFTLAILGYKWWKTTASHIDDKVSHTTFQPKEKILSKPTEKSMIEKHMRVNQPKAPLNIQDTGIESLDKKMSIQTHDPFEEVDIDALKSYIKPLKGVVPLYAVSMKKYSIINSHIGDIMLLPSIDGTIYEMIIKNKSHSATGTSTIHGEYSDNGITYHSILTEGPYVSFISMTTPTGSYEGNLIDTEGYIYASADIENKKIDYEKSDTLMAPMKEERESLQ